MNFNNQERKKLLEKIKQLQDENFSLKKRKKYGLVWEDKPEKFDEESKNSLPILKEKGEKFKDVLEKGREDDDYNILIEGDNYHSLSVLSYTHEKKIDVIYIDPPYNTGNKDFFYNDTFIDKENSFRHSKWLSFMNKRLRLAKDLLKDDGVIFISIDDNEQSQLKLLMDEIFGENNLLSVISVKTSNPNGFKIFGNYPVRLKDYFLMYNKKNFLYNRQYVSGRISWDAHFNLFIEKNNKIFKLKDILIKEGFLSKKDKLEDLNLEDKDVKKFYLSNRDKIFQTGFYKNSPEKNKSLENRDSIINIVSSTGLEYRLLNGRLLTSLSKSIHYISEENREDLSFPLGDFMGDIEYNNIQNETPLKKL